jgi:hypothetical protein
MVAFFGDAQGPRLESVKELCLSLGRSRMNRERPLFLFERKDAENSIIEEG